MTSDLDGDGWGEALVSDFDFGPIQEGKVYLFDGKTTQLLYSYTGTVSSDWLGFDVAGLGDLNGDGVGDFGAVGFTSYLWSGLDGSDLASLPTYSSIARLGDVNADGLDDVVVCDIDFNETAQVFAGGSYELLSISEAGLWWVSYFGFDVAGVGDTNGDGVPDFVVGAPGIYPAVCAIGYAGQFSGADGSLLHYYKGHTLADQYGHAVSGVGDVTGDGLMDIAIGSPSCCAVGGCSPGFRGRLDVIDGSTGAKLY
jgi:hypothetical protein